MITGKMLEQLSAFGKVLSIKDSIVFTLLMEVDNHKAKTIAQIGYIASNFIPDKPNIDVMYNDDKVLLLVLKK